MNSRQWTKGKVRNKKGVNERECERERERRDRKMEEGSSEESGRDLGRSIVSEDRSSVAEEREWCVWRSEE